MKLFGFEISRRTKTHTSTFGLSAVPSHGGWFPLVVHEPFTGAWQRNLELRQDTVLSFSAVYACVTLIASDIAKLRVKLVEQDAHGLWHEVRRDSPFWRVLRKPNHFQTRIEFFEQWMASKLIHGNTYVLKHREQARGMVSSMYVLDPTRVQVLVAPDSSVFYALGVDNLSRIEESGTVVPASEIIHDIYFAPFHPLYGVSPISACGLAALQGLKVQQHSESFFANGAQPGGIITGPHHIPEETAKRLQEHWESNYGGINRGRTAVIGDGLEYKPITMNATDSQLIEQLKWTAENVCQAFRVPPYKVGVGPPPAQHSIEALDQQYYSQCLQTHVEKIELRLDEGLETAPMGTEFELDDLLRMDTATRVKTAREAIQAGAAPNEVRLKYHDLPPVQGGDVPFLQEQNWPIEQLASRPTPEREITPPAERAAAFLARLNEEAHAMATRHVQVITR